MPDKEQEVILPDDRYDRELLANVRPEGWTDPEPAPVYNLVVIGAGTAGLVAAAGAAGLGAKVALVEKRMMGGDCLNLGCVPSKTIISSSRVMEGVKDAGGHGIRVLCGADADFPVVMERMRRLRARISRNDSAARFRELGVDVFLGAGVFTGHHMVEAGGRTLRFRKAVIATGAHPLMPPVEGLAGCGYLTNENIFNLTVLPKRLAVLGGGAIGCEMAQAFARLGSEVTILHRSTRLMDKEDPDASKVVEAVFSREGISVIYGDWTLRRVETRGGEKLLHMFRGEEERVIAADQVLVSVGRVPNVDGLGLDAAGVRYDPRSGVFADDHLRTTNTDVFAAGDVCGRYKFTHMADAAARIVIQNALFKGRKKLSDVTVPWCTFTDPEVAHVGLYEDEARRQGIEVETFVRRYSDVDRAVLEGREEGFVKVHVVKGSDRILGATIVAQSAGDMLGELTLAISRGIGLGALADVIQPYPTMAEGIKHVADMYNRTRLTPRVKKWVARWLERMR
ncbi:MAG: mercuric reductase [Nitrospirae bacterium]|nr:mercuric reductase [Nitrospirota bacterium]